MGRMVDHCSELSRFMFSAASASQGVEPRCRAAVDRAEALAQLEFTNSVLSGLATLPRVYVFLPSEILCPDGEARCLTVVGGHVLYKDDNHINAKGADFIRPALSRVVERIVTDRQ